jgi:hypothetical protein
MAPNGLSPDGPDTAPPYCNPCIFYSGDFNPKKLANGLLDGAFVINNTNEDGQVWVPFAVKKQAVITGLFVNELFNSTSFSSVPVTWEIRSGVATGEPGISLCSGSGTASATPTGRTFEAEGELFTEMTIQIQLPPGQPCVVISADDESVTDSGSVDAGNPLRIPPPHGQCTGPCFANVAVQPPGPARAPQDTILGYLSDVEGAGAHHFGLKNVLDDSFFFSSSLEIDYQPTAGPDGVCALAGGTGVALTEVGCDMFSIGLTGTTMPAPTKTALSSSPNPSNDGEPVTFTATVTSAEGAPPDGETVSFMNGTVLLGTGSLIGGAANFTTSKLKVGTTTVKAVYGGDPAFAGSTSSPLKQVVE